MSKLYKLSVTVKKYRGGYMYAMWGMSSLNENKRLFRTKIVFRVFHSGLKLTDTHKGIISHFVYDKIKQVLQNIRFWKEDNYQLDYDSATDSSLKVFTRESEVDFNSPTEENIEQKRKRYEADLRKYIDEWLDMYIRQEKK
jgi:hypothetical protein